MKKQSSINAALVNAVAPMAINFSQNSFDLGDKCCVGMTATRFPATAKYEWLTDICNIKNTVASITYTPDNDPELILKSIGNTVASNQSVADGVVPAEPVERVRAQKIVTDGTKIIEQIANHNESVGYCAINILAIGKDKNDAVAKAKSAKSKFIGRRFNVSTIPFMQKEVFKAVSPCDLAPELLNDVGNQLLPLSTLLGGFPFAFAGYNDGAGSYWGKDGSGSPIIIDLWRRGGDRANSNIVVLGISGGGKSTALKHLMLSEWEIGTRFIIIDPHGEYKEICQNLGGEWIDVVGGEGGRINPFHIYKHFDKEGEKKKLNDLAKHINNLDVFFNLYADMTSMQSAALKECIERAYFNREITWETNVEGFYPHEFPIMDDLFMAIEEKANEHEPTLRASETNIFKELLILMRNISKGSDSFIWNSYSTVNPTSDFVVFDTSSVNGTTNNIRSALYHTVLNYCEDYLYRNPKERVVLVADEAHNVIDKRIPATTARLANIEKSVRKFESAIWICSQELIDFLDEQIRKEGQVLLEQPNIKLLMPVGKGRDLKELKELYDLTDAEEDRLLQQQQGKGILFIGSKRLTIDFDIPLHHFELMGTGGGR